jgi:hypothetical protein
MQPILAGQTVPGVNVNMSAADMQACKTKAVAMQSHMQNRMQGRMQNQNPAQ